MNRWISGSFESSLITGVSVKTYLMKCWCSLQCFQLADLLYLIWLIDSIQLIQKNASFTNHYAYVFVYKNSLKKTLKLWWWVKHSPSRSSSKSSTKNSRSGGRLGCFSVFTSCWILAETRLLTGTPMKRIQPNKPKLNKYYHSYINQMSWICLNEPINTHTHTQGCLGLNDWP